MKLPLLLLSLLFVACSQPQPSTVAVARNDVKPSNEAKTKNENVPPPSTVTNATPELNVAFGKGLRIIPKEIKLENPRLRYKIDVKYPQIEGTKNPQILKLNRRIRSLVAEQYRWPLSSAKEDMRLYDKFPGVFNTVDLTYSVPFATDDLLSIYFEGYNYGIGAAHSAHHSFTVNYDLKNGKLLKLGDIFKSSTNYLHFVSQYCMNDLTKRYGDAVFRDELFPKAENYQSWNITDEGIEINFDSCSVLACADGQQTTLIPFATLKEMLNPKNPVILLAK